MKRSLKLFAIVIATTGLLITTAGCGDLNKLHKGKGSFVFNDPGIINGKFINVYYYMPANYNSNSPILFVLHGVNRNADEYRDEWNELAEKYNVLLLVPEFSEALFPLDQDYNMGNMFVMNLQDSLLGTKPQSQWAFSLIEPIFDFVKNESKNNSEGYYIYGHSAGSQFVQRFILYTPNARFIKAVSANSGWYTMVSFNEKYPYGVKETLLTNEQLAKVFKKNFIVLLGTEDNDPHHKYLRVTPEAMRQGAHRLERGQTFYKKAKEYAGQNNMKFDWEMLFVEGVGHSNKKMSKSAADLLFGTND
ncbi:MAG: hypothetical protein PVH88_15160 [Ignavibacteria bacterium]|jgi:hypothetical protein